MTMQREIHHDHADQASAGGDLEIVVIAALEDPIEVPCYAVDPVALQRRSRTRHTRLHQLTYDDQSYACNQD